MSAPVADPNQPRVFNSLQQISKTGEFKRTATDFHCQISKDHEVYQPEKNRYCLYVSYACPWANRTLIVLNMLGLKDVIDVVAVHPVWGVVDESTGRKSWVFGHENNKQPEGPLRDAFENPLPKDHPDNKDFQEYLNNINLKASQVGNISVQDKNYGFSTLRQLYELHDPSYQGRYTVPVLWDTKTKTIVNNESSEIMQILDKGFIDFRTKHTDGKSILCPAETKEDGLKLQQQIDEENIKMYNPFNNGVYRAGFASSQFAHLSAIEEVYNYLNYLDDKLSKQRFICGNVFTEADIRCIVTLFRFDPVYVTHFKCTVKRIADYPNIVEYLADIWQNILSDCDAQQTVNITHIKYHYYCSHETLNKYAIVPKTMDIDYTQQNDRSTRFH